MFYDQISYFDFARLIIQIIGYSGIIISILMVYRQMHVGIFCEYTRRFNDIEQELSPLIRDSIETKSYSEFDEEQKRQIRNVLRKYLNMCSEEFHLHRSGFINKSTWKIWELGIKETLNISAMRAALNDVKDEYRYFDEFYKYLMTCVDLSEPKS